MGIKGEHIPLFPAKRQEPFSLHAISLGLAFGMVRQDPVEKANGETNFRTPNEELNKNSTLLMLDMVVSQNRGNPNLDSQIL